MRHPLRHVPFGTIVIKLDRYKNLDPQGGMKETEANIKRAIRDYLELKRYVVVSVRNVGIVKPDGAYIPLPKGDRGISDIIACSPAGRFCAIEVKKKGNKPSTEQLEFLDRVHQANGIGIVAYSLDDIMRLL